VELSRVLYTQLGMFLTNGIGDFEQLIYHQASRAFLLCVLKTISKKCPGFQYRLGFVTHLTLTAND
jgi:hypothetical protein